MSLDVNNYNFFFNTENVIKFMLNDCTCDVVEETSMVIYDITINSLLIYFNVDYIEILHRQS